MPKKLLLADDSVTIQRVIELTFADEDVAVTAVGDGRQAIDRLRADRPDIVLADIGMPERDGYDVAAFIKNDPELAHIPVILLTGAFEPLDEDRARRVGCDGVLVKPFEPQMVINRVKELLSNRRPPAAAVPPPAATPVPQPAAAPVRSADAFAAALDASLEPPPRTSEAAKTDDALEAYFDRLDAAFASIGEPGGRKQPPGPARTVQRNRGVQEPPRQRTPAEDPLRWDPDLAATASPARQPAPAPVAQQPDPRRRVSRNLRRYVGRSCAGTAAQTSPTRSRRSSRQSRGSPRRSSRSPRARRGSAPGAGRDRARSSSA